VRFFEAFFYDGAKPVAGAASDEKNMFGIHHRFLDFSASLKIKHPLKL